MATLTLTAITLAGTPVTNELVNIKIRKTADADVAASYTNVGDFYVSPNGNFISPVNITGLLSGTQYTIWVINKCSNTSFTQGFGSTPYKNTVQSQAFTKACSAGHTGQSVTYTVPAGTYSSVISQDDANNQALDDIATNGQTYANANGYCSVVVNVHLVEASSPYSDGNLELKNNGVEVARVTGGGDTSYEILVPGGSVSFEAFSERPSTGANPKKTMNVKRNGSDVYPATTNANNPSSPSLSYAETSHSGDTYDVYVTATADALPADATGIFVVDVYDDAGLNICGYVNTPGTTPYQIAVYVGNNFEPPSVPPESCWVLASDAVVSGSLRRRFEFNIAALLSTYPSMTSFDFVIAGRTTSSGTINGQYNRKGAAAGMMIMTGSPGTYLPSTSGTTNIDIVVYSGKAIVGGADGTYGLGVGAVIMTFTYDVVAKTITVTP